MQVGDKVSWYYDGRLMDGTQFDSGTYTATIGAGQVIKGKAHLKTLLLRLKCQGVDIGLRGMCIGEKRLLRIPSHEAYGERGKTQEEYLNHFWLQVLLAAESRRTPKSSSTWN